MIATEQLTERQRVSKYRQVARLLPASHDPEFTKGIRKIAIGACIAQYGVLSVKGNATQGLKLLVKKMGFAAQQVQNWFINNKATDGSFAEVFLREFDGDRILMISELLDTVCRYDAESLSDINELILSSQTEVADGQVDDIGEICEMLAQVKDTGAIKNNLRMIIQNQLNKENI
jgi:hypothetical protein